MYGQRMFCAEDRLPPNYDLFGDGDFQLLQSPSPSQLYTTQQQPWSSGDNMGPAKSSTTMLSRFKSPASAFYAAEELMGFPQNPKTPDAEFPLYRSSCESFSINSAEKGYQDSSAATKILPPQRQNILAVDDAAFALRRKVSFNSYSSYHHVPQLSFSSHQEKQQFSKFSCTSNSSANTSTTTSTFGCPVLPNKTRIRWTQDLHEKFVECVNRLGGAEKATPKAILKLMDTDGLTIFHIKSHLQKYRIAKYIPDSAEGRSDRRTSMNDVTRLDVKNGLQIKEALQLQLDVQRQLHEQLEIQRNLQLRIEEQGRQLRMMFNQQQKQSTNTLLLDNNQDDDDKSLEDSLFSVAADGSDDSYFHSKIS